MTLFLDTSALLAAHIAGPHRAALAALLATEDVWCASALAAAEFGAGIDRIGDDPFVRSDLEDAVRLTWDRLHVVPVDAACLSRAGHLLRDQPLRVADAIHLAAADRLPRPVRYATLDPAQIPVALGLGFEVLPA
jgi:uncharacterized protein